ncbi:MAG: nucleotidyl transferase AbiEii/AbiGii toxin family protein [Candidatus Omnitrophica bacterium]|nr:nucleotidyl transferase AbiEii/AbiGii toxin family protein [Candidatus Omnitrophota bacterium]
MHTYEDIFRGFNAHKISYIVIGGLAVNFHGIPRMTYDIDILIDFSKQNITRFEKLMREWGFQPKMPVKIIDIADENKRAQWIARKHMKAFNLVNPAWTLSELDVLIDSPISFDKAKRGSRMITMKGIAIPVLGVKDLIALKRVSGRLQDQDDIENLRKVRYEK